MPSPVIDGAKFLQQFARLRERAGIGCIQPAQFAGLAHAPVGQFQCQGGEIAAQDLGCAVACHALLLPRCPEAVASSRSQPAGASAALVCRVPGDEHGVEPVHARAGIEAGLPFEAAVDHDVNALDGQAGLGDRRRQHHLALSGGRGLYRQVLGGGGKRAMQRRQSDFIVADNLTQCAFHLADLPRAGKKHQEAAALTGERLQHHMRHLVAESPEIARRVRVQRPVPEGHRKIPAGTGQHRRFPQLGAPPRSVERGGHYQQAQVLTQAALLLEAQGQGVGPPGGCVRGNSSNTTRPTSP